MRDFEALLVKEMDYIDLNLFPENDYYNAHGNDGGDDHATDEKLQNAKLNLNDVKIEPQFCLWCQGRSGYYCKIGFPLNRVKQN